MDQLNFTHNPLDSGEQMHLAHDDVDMSEAHLVPNESPDFRDDETLAALHDEAVELYATKMRVVPECIPRPKLITIYFDPDRALVPAVPTDLQLIVYFTIYNCIARGNFLALKSSAQHLDISRAIWYYGVDPGHAFAMFSHHIRWNIIIMTFLWSTGFDTQYCKPGCAEFVVQFIKAWIESLVYKYNINHNDFSEREKFIHLWKTCPFDLYIFSRNDEEKMSGRIEFLSKKLNNTKDLPKHEDFVQAVRSGKITPELFERYGPALAFQWVMGKEDKAKVDQKAADEANDNQQIDLDIQKAKEAMAASAAKLERMEARRAAGERFDEEDVAIAYEPSFDPFPDDVHPGIGHVVWDKGILETLRFPLDAEPKTFKQIQKARPKPDETTFYISKAQIFGGVFAVKRKEDEHDGPGYETLVTAFNTKLL